MKKPECIYKDGGKMPAVKYKNHDVTIIFNDDDVKQMPGRLVHERGMWYVLQNHEAGCRCDALAKSAEYRYSWQIDEAVKEIYLGHHTKPLHRPTMTAVELLDLRKNDFCSEGLIQIIKMFVDKKYLDMPLDKLRVELKKRMASKIVMNEVKVKKSAIKVFAT